jgi:hypothetical protein
MARGVWRVRRYHCATLSSSLSGVAAGEAHEAAGDGELVGEAEHREVEEAGGVVQRARGARTGGDGAGVARRGGFEVGLAVVPADFVGEAGGVAEVDEVGAAADAGRAASRRPHRARDAGRSRRGRRRRDGAPAR